MKTSTPKLSISVAECARRTGLTARALRIYERAGLIRPARSAHGWRVYGHEDLVRLNAIVALKALGLSLTQIRKALSSPSPLALREVLQMQREVWRKRRVAADEGAALVRMALASLDGHEQLSLDDLCHLARRMDMQNLQAMRREAINELIGAEEERIWMTWWAKRPPGHVEALQRYSAAQMTVMEDLAKQLAKGTDAAAEEVQALLRQWVGNLTCYQARGMMLDMMRWNTPLTRKWLTVGERVMERRMAATDHASHPHIWRFLRAAFKASPMGNRQAALLDEARAFAAAGMAPTTAEAISLAARFRHLCHEFELGDPVVYARWTCGMGMALETGERVDLEPASRAAWDFLADACEAGQPRGTA